MADVSAVHFEAVKIAAKQDKNGYVLTLSIHPSQVPEEIFRDLVGQRYIIAMSALTDQDEPVDRENQRGVKLFNKINAMLRDDKNFTDWLYEPIKDTPAPEQKALAKQALKRMLSIDSLTEIKSKPAVIESLSTLLMDYETYLSKAGLSGKTGIR